MEIVSVSTSPNTHFFSSIWKKTFFLNEYNIVLSSFFIFEFFLHGKYAFYKFSSTDHMGLCQSISLSSTFGKDTIAIDTTLLVGLSGFTYRTGSTSLVGLMSAGFSQTSTFFYFFSSMVNNFYSFFLLRGVGSLEFSYNA